MDGSFDERLCILRQELLVLWRVHMDAVRVISKIRASTKNILAPYGTRQLSIVALQVEGAHVLVPIANCQMTARKNSRLRAIGAVDEEAFAEAELCCRAIKDTHKEAHQRGVPKATSLLIF